MKKEDTQKKSAMTPATSEPRPKAARATNPAAKRRVKITLPTGKQRDVATKAALKPVAAAKPAARPAAKPAATGAVRSRKPAAQRQLIKVTKPRARKPAIAVPPLLLEGDEPSRTPAVGGPGSRYALGPSAPPVHAARLDETGDLPDAYGTQKLLLTARDPHWLYAHWDFTREQMKRLNALSADGHLILRVFADRIAGEPVVTQHVHPDSRNWFVFVGRGGTRFVAELGYRDAAGGWIPVTSSRPALTPPDSMSDDTSVRFANLPAEVPFDQILDVVKAAVSEHVPLLEALEQLRPEFPQLPPVEAFAAKSGSRASPPPALTPAQEKALADVVTMDAFRRVWIGSLEITELVKRQLADGKAGAMSSAAASQRTALDEQPSSPLGAVSSFQKSGARPSRGFWFNVNAELIVYGATETDAAVTIGGRRIKLRPDGTFSYRFALPDGRFPLPIEAVSADEVEARAADLHFSRVTHYLGDVPGHPQDAALKPPVAQSVA